MMLLNQYGAGYNDDYYNNFYLTGKCFQGCPINSNCKYGFCECNAGFSKISGGCYRSEQEVVPRPQHFLDNPFIACTETVNECQKIDINMVCHNGTQGGLCDCRDDFTWNADKTEFEFYLDVDCSSITYDTPVSPIVDEAANITLMELEEENVNVTDTNSTAPEDVMNQSMLRNIDPINVKESDIREAFCRDMTALAGSLVAMKKKNEMI